MPAFALTAEQIAAQIAAEQAAAAAAQQAAAMAAQQAAAEAAAQAAAQAAAEQAATQAATQAGTQAATQAATQASTNGIQALAQEVGVGSQPTGIDQLTQAFQRAQESNIPMSREQFLNNSFAGPVQGQYIDLSGVPAGQVSPNATIDPLTNAPYIQAQNVTPVNTVPTPFGASPVAPASPNPTVSYPQSPSVTSVNGAPPPVAQSALDTEAFENLNLNDQVVNPQKMDGQEPPFEYVNNTAYPKAPPPSEPSGIEELLNKGVDWAKKNPLTAGMGAMSVYNMLNRPKPYEKPKYKSTFDASKYRGYEPTPPNPPYRAQYAGGGPIEMMSNANAVGANTGYPMAGINKGAYATPYQTPISRNVVSDTSDTGVNPVTGEMLNFARGGISDLGSYSDYARGGRMLKGPGDGMSDDIPATIANKQPARLANEEFVIPADVVSHLGNGSSEAGAKALYKMMDRVRQARTGNKKQGKQINPDKYLA